MTGINLNYLAGDGDESFRWLLRWREKGRLVDAKRAFKEMVECEATIPQDLAKVIASSLQIPDDNPTQGVEQFDHVNILLELAEDKDLQNYITKVFGEDGLPECMKNKEPPYVMDDIFKHVAKEHGVAWETVQKNYYRQRR